MKAVPPDLLPGTLDMIILRVIAGGAMRSEEHTSELQSLAYLFSPSLPYTKTNIPT